MNQISVPHRLCGCAQRSRSLGRWGSSAIVSKAARPAAGPSTMDTATARLSATTGEGQTDSSRYFAIVGGLLSVGGGSVWSHTISTTEPGQNRQADHRPPDFFQRSSLNSSGSSQTQASRLTTLQACCEP